MLTAICKLEGCSEEICVEGDKIHEFCCRSHAFAYMENKAKEGEF